MKSVYRIETSDIVIRCYDPTDAKILKNAIDNSLDHLKPWMPWAKYEPQDLDKKVELLRNFRGQFDLDMDHIYGIFTKDEKELIGGTGLHKRIASNGREIGYWINEKFIGKGFATESVKCLIRIGFELYDLNLIEIRCAPENKRSARVAEKLGFNLEAILKNRLIDGEIRDQMIWSLFRNDYEKSSIKYTVLKAYDVTGNQLL